MPSASTAVGGRLFVVGGFTGAHTPVGTVEVYSP